jgi:hypothetical protein
MRHNPGGIGCPRGACTATGERQRDFSSNRGPVKVGRKPLMRKPQQPWSVPDAHWNKEFSAAPLLVSVGLMSMANTREPARALRRRVAADGRATQGGPLTRRISEVIEPSTSTQGCDRSKDRWTPYASPSFPGEPVKCLYTGRFVSSFVARSS